MLPKYCIPTVDQFGRPVTAIVEDPYWLLASRVLAGILSAKQAAQTTIYLAEETPLDVTVLRETIRWEQLIEQAKRDPGAIIKLVQSNALPEGELARLREDLEARTGCTGQYAAPWPWESPLSEADRTKLIKLAEKMGYQVRTDK